MCTCGGNHACNVAGEICQNGQCMCGNISSCGGKMSGSYCDSTRSKCKCSSTVDACHTTTDRCINEQCTCGIQENLVCNGTSDRCTEGACKCGKEVPCSVDGEICIDGICKCGIAGSCEGKMTGSYCDSSNSVCKCGPNVDACNGSTDTCIRQKCSKCGSLDPCMIPGETCQLGVCKCGTAESCANKISGEFCVK